MPPRRPPDASKEDHDLLLRIDTKVDIIQSTLQETRTALSARIDRLAQEKASIQELDTLRKFIERVQQDGADRDSEQNERIDSTSRTLWIGVGIVLAVEVTIVPGIVGALVYWLTHSH